ncbi:hypothetical protein A2U01_0000851 [Trifolium medium]|uniref:Envelope-like protein n=1 Tax=Trifolium medium TaxID=97028 RepID=A0A392LYQ0_9FABA|nr:hypothetical protein [Trifolium medium]
MAASTSNPIQSQENQQDVVPSIIKKGDELRPARKEMKFSKNKLYLLEDRPVDFENFKANGFDIEPLFIAQEFWIKRYAFDEEYRKDQEKLMVETNPGLRGQTREQMGLEPYVEDEIRSNFNGVSFVIKREHIAKLLGLQIKGIKLHTYGKNEIRSLRDIVTHAIMKDGRYEGDAEGRMHNNCRVIYRMMLNTIVPRRGGTGTISWTYKHAIYFLIQGRKIDLVDFIFQNLCNAMTSSIKNNHPNVAYPRLLSELFLQSMIVECIKPVFSSLLLNITPKTRLYNNGFPVISQADLVEVQQFFIDDVNKETGANLTLADVPPAQEVIMPKRGKRKAKQGDDEKKSKKKVGSSSAATTKTRRSKHKHEVEKAGDGRKIIKGSGKGLLIKTDKGMSSKLSENISVKAHIDKQTLGEIFDQKPFSYKETFLPKQSYTSKDTQLEALEADIDTYTARSSVQSESDNIVHTFYPTFEPSSDLNFMHNLEAHTSGVIFNVVQQSGTSEPSVQVKSQPDLSMLSRVLNQQETTQQETQPQPEKATMSDKPDIVNQQLTQPQQEKALASDTTMLSDTINNQQQLEQASVSDIIPIQPDTDILTSDTILPVSETVEVIPTQQVETMTIPEPEPKLKEAISSESSLPEEKEEILHFDIRNTTPEPMPEPLSIELLQENIRRSLQRAAYLRDAGVMPSEDLVKEMDAIHEKLTKTLKRTFEDMSKAATASLPQKVSKKLKAEDVKMITSAPWCDIKAEEEEKLRKIIAEDLRVDFEENKQLILDPEAQQFEDESFNHWIEEGEAMVQELAKEGETFATRRIQANLTKQRVLVEKVIEEQNRQAEVQAKQSRDIAHILTLLQPQNH